MSISKLPSPEATSSVGTGHEDSVDEDVDRAERRARVGDGEPVGSSPPTTTVAPVADTVTVCPPPSGTRSGVTTVWHAAATTSSGMTRSIDDVVTWER